MLEQASTLSNTKSEILFTLTEEQFSRLATVLDKVPSGVVSSQILRYPELNIDSRRFYAVLQLFMSHVTNLPYLAHGANVETDQNMLFSQSLEQFDTFDKVMTYAKHEFAKSDISSAYLLDRLKSLEQMADEEGEEKLSVPSLKGMMLFLFMLKEFDKPKITLNDNGVLQINWRRGRDNAITVNFKNLHTVNYVIFRPSRHTNKRTILNGTMNIFDLLDYMNELQVQVYKVTEGHAPS